MMLSDVGLTCDVCLSVAYIGPKSRTERARKTKNGTAVAHVTRDSATTFKVKRSKVNLQGTGAYCGGLPHSLLELRLAVNGQLCERSLFAWLQPAAMATSCEKTLFLVVEWEPKTGLEV